MLCRGHFKVTRKALVAALVSVIGILSAYDLVSPEAAVALSAAVVPVLAVLMPTRDGIDNIEENNEDEHL